MHENDITLRFIISIYRAYSLSMFYSSLHSNWIENSSSRMASYLSDPQSIYISRSLPTAGAHIEWLEYYLIANQSSVFIMTVCWFKGDTTHLIIHAGPGRLSNILYKNDGKTSHEKSNEIKTASFVTFTRILSSYTTSE